MLMDPIWDLLEDQLFDRTSTECLFNMYRDRHAELDIPDAPAVRRANLRGYLLAYDRMPSVFLLVEAPGPWGARFTGVPITSESQLLDDTFPLTGRRTSDGGDPHSEYSARIFWRVLEPYFPAFLTWNTVPFHPHKAGKPLSIRTPAAAEIDSFESITAAFVDAIRPGHVAAIGRKAERALDRLGVENTYVRHPSQGGAKLFEEGVTSLLHRAGIA
ncbi:MAG: uracil-DNA glycosylase [Rhodothermales bacterium]